MVLPAGGEVPGDGGVPGGGGVPRGGPLPGGGGGVPGGTGQLAVMKVLLAETPWFRAASLDFAR